MTERTPAHVPNAPRSKSESPSSIRPVELHVGSTQPPDAASHWHWRRAVLGAVSVCAIAMISLQLAKLTANVSREVPHLNVYVERDGQLTRRDPNAPAHAGEQLRLTYSSDSDSFLAIFHTDAQRGVRVYTPSHDTAAQHVPAGEDVMLGSSVRLDDRHGVERLSAVFCPEPFDTQPLVVGWLTRGKLAAQPECQVDVVQLTKSWTPR